MLTLNARQIVLDNTCPATWRPTFATPRRQASFDLRVRQEPLSHQPASPLASALGMTGAYIHTNPEFQRSEIERAHCLRQQTLDLIVNSQPARSAQECIMHQILKGVFLIAITLTAVNCKEVTGYSRVGPIAATRHQPRLEVAAFKAGGCSLTTGSDGGLEVESRQKRAARDWYCQSLQSRVRRGRREQKSLKPRNGHTLIVGIVARISGCQNQKELSLDDQVDHAMEEVAELYDGPVDYRIIKTTGKGERLDRPELMDVERMLRSRELDLLVAEDLGRIVRGTAAKDLCAIAVDHNTRVIVPNDAIDTDDPNWEEDVIGACQEHVGHNAQTSKRLKHKLMNRFKKLGGAMARSIAGYIVPAGARTYYDWVKDDEAGPVILEGFRILQQTLNGGAVADYFNKVTFKGAVGFPTGRYCRTTKRWTGSFALRYYRNRMLSGRPGRGFRRTIKHHETGRRISVRNPDGPIFQDFEHLRFINPADHDALIQLLTTKNEKYRRARTLETDPRARVPRKRTRWPGQTGSTCWYCGKDECWGANGMSKSLMCSGARTWTCWNSVGFSGAIAARRIGAALDEFLQSLDQFDAQLRSLIETAAQDGNEDIEGQQQRLERDERALEVQRENVAAVVRRHGDSPIVADALDAVNAEAIRLSQLRRKLDGQRHRPICLPQSADQLRRLFQEAFADLAAGSPEFGEALRRVVPEFHVFLVRLCDGGHLLPRARAMLAFDGLVPDAHRVPGYTETLSRVVILDLFEVPERERIRETCVAMQSEGICIDEIARRLNVAKKLVERSLSLNRKMQSLGLANPYVFVAAPPDNYTKLRRHHSSRYRFVQRDGYVPPSLPWLPV